MAEIVSALQDVMPNGEIIIASDGNEAVSIREILPFSLTQVSGWPETLGTAGRAAAKMAGMSKPTDPGKCRSGKSARLLRVEPLKWWVLSDGLRLPELPKNLTAKSGCLLDLSHSRTWLKISGDQAPSLLNRFLPLDLREDSFPLGQVATTAFHHIGVTLWREKEAYHLLLPRSFAASLAEMLEESAKQFG